jgi:RHS repeat-associated protein
MTQVQQYGVAGGNAVGEKRVDFRYNALGQFTMIQRFRDLAGGQMAAYSQFGYDAYGNLRAIEHRYPAGAMISQYSYTHDDLDRITSVVDPAGTTNYNYDETSQLVSADYSPLPTNPSPLADESYSYDLNGNRTNTGYVTAADNRLEQAEIDGKLHSFQYDSEGNLIRRTNLSTGEVVEYTWDRRNRLVRVTERNTLDGPPTTDVSFSYDAFDRRIVKTVSYPSSLNPQPSSELFVYDGIHIALVFTDPDASGPQPSTLDSRLLFGPAVDQVLAEEHPSTLNAQPSSRTYWLLSDHLGSIRDTLSPNCTGGGHIDYTAFGRVAAVFDYLGGAATLDAIAAKRFLFTGREWDAASDLYYYRARYYDAAIARFIGQDPISFGGDDANLYRYVGNNSSNLSDPSGLAVARDPVEDLLDRLDARRRDQGTLSARDGLELGHRGTENQIAVTDGPAKAVDAAAGVILDAGHRVLGGAQAINGAVEATLGVTCMVALPTPLTIAGCGLVAAHGVDMVQAGVRTAATGKPTPTVTSTVVAGGLHRVGVGPQAAGVAGVVVDMGLSIGGSYAAGAAIRSATISASGRAPHVQPPLTRGQRLAEYFNRLRGQPASRTADEALDRIGRTLDEVEDALSGVPRKNPPPPPKMPDGRMYPPQADNIVRNADGSISARTAGHRIQIGADGSITIRNIETGGIDFHQPGAGRGQ